MRNIKIYKEEEDALFFILTEFVNTHNAEDCKDIYKKELKLSERLIKDSKRIFTKYIEERNNGLHK